MIKLQEFNLELITRHILYDWTVGLIRPVYKKKGDALNTNNYRCITLLFCFKKLFTCLSNNRLHEYLV